jgi:spore coat protein CotF
VTHLTQKERSLLQDQLSHEKVCIEKYSSYAQKTKSPDLRRMFNEFAQEEQQHYHTVSGLLGQGSSQQSGSQQFVDQQSGGRQTAGQQSGGQQGGTFMSGRTVFGGQVPGAQQPRGYEQRDIQDTVDRAPQYMEGRQTMQQMGWTEVSQELTSDSSRLSGADSDASMLNDMLMTEKYVSGTYDTAVFESPNPQVRQALQHIQQDEQKHGEGIFRYMQQHGMYNPS